MKTIVTLIICMFLTLSAHAANCKPQSLSPAALSLVKPLIEVRIKQNAEEFTEDGHWRGESQYSGEVERQFYSLLENRTAAGDEAIAYLLNVYMGEHLGEELVCEVINPGNRMLPLIKTYSECIPIIGLEPLHKFVQGSGVLPGYAIEGITKGEKCDHH